jgi:CheY-like chemotaxis protein
MSILLVDDDREFRELLAQYLGDAGFHVEQASDGVDGVHKALALLPEAIVTDYAMPEMTGDRLVRLLTADPRTRGIPIVFLSALPHMIPAPVRAASTMLLVKPCPPDHICALLRVMVEARRSVVAGRTSSTS